MRQIEIRVGSPTGNRFALSVPDGSAETGDWVSDGTRFYLLDAADGRILSELTVRLGAAGCPINASLTADPNPIQVCDSSGRGVTKIIWDAPDYAKTEIRVRSPEGNRLAADGPRGEANTGKWVGEGTEFFLIDPRDGNVLRTLRVDVTNEGCPPEAPDQGSIPGS